MICSAVAGAALALSAVGSVATVVARRREVFALLYYFIVLAVPIALIVGIVWASPWSRYGRK